MTEYKNILVAVDFSEAAQSVIKHAIDIAQRNKTQLTVMHVVEYLPPIDIAYEPVMNTTWAIDETELAKQAEDSLNKFCVKHKLTDAKQIVVIGTPKHEITEYAKKHGCDLIILGSHGRHGLRLLLGSTANGVLNAMPCNVLAIKVED